MSIIQNFTKWTSPASKHMALTSSLVALLLAVTAPRVVQASDTPSSATVAPSDPSSAQAIVPSKQSQVADAAPTNPSGADDKKAEPSAVAAPLATPGFRPSESLAFDVSYLGIPVGTLSLTIANPVQHSGVETWPLIANAKTASAFVFYPVKDRYVSWFDPKLGLSVGNDFLANENREVRRERVTFDRQKQKAIFRRDGGGKSSKEAILDIPPNAQDLLAMIYRFRMTPMNVGDVFESPICTGQRTFITKATVMGTETIQVGAGQFSTKRVHVEVAFSGQLASKREMRIFFTDDERHMPVRVDAEFFLGKLVADLTSFSSGF